MDNSKIYEKVKIGLGLSIIDDFTETTLKQIIDGGLHFFTEVKGILPKLMESETGVQLLTIYTNDVWKSGGKFEFSPATDIFFDSLMTMTRRAEGNNSDGGISFYGVEEAPDDDKQYGRQNKDWTEVETQVSNLLFMTTENSNTVLSTQMPEVRQVLLPMTWFGVEPETWRDVLTFTPTTSISSQYFEVIQGNRFFAKIFLNSDVARTAARVRLQLIDTSDNAILATATQIVDFPTMSTINVPILFEGFYQVVRRVPLSRIRLIISVMTSLFGFQIQIFTNPPNEISFISQTSTTTITEEEIRNIVYEAIRRAVEG